MPHPKLRTAFGPPGTRDSLPKTLLKNFAKCLEHYNELRRFKKKDRRDVAYWYGERTLTGLLSGALWRMKGERWALEEFKSRRKVGRRKKGGRGDLWFGLSHRESYTLEAKLYEESGQSILRDKIENRLVRNTQAKMEKAFRQLAELQPIYRVGKPMAACFTVPYFEEKCTELDEVENFFRRVARSTCWKRRETMVGAFWYANGGLRYLDKAHPAKYYLAPGVIVVLQWQKKFSPKR